MRLLAIATLLCGSAFAQGWSTLPGTSVKVGSANSVCVPDHFNSTVPGWPDITWYSADLAFRTCDAHLSGLYNGGLYDPVKDRYCTIGGGHNGNQDNAWYCLDLSTVSQSSATCGGVPCKIHSGTANAGDAIAPGNAVWTRMDDPSLPNSSCPPPNPTADGRSVSLQSYGSPTYLPRVRGYFVGGSANFCATGEQYTAFVVDADKLGTTSDVSQYWHRKADRPYAANGTGEVCTLDPTVTDQDAIVCVVTGSYLYRFLVPSNPADPGTWTLLKTFSPQLQAGNSLMVVADPKRRMLYIAGPAWTGNNNSPKFWQVMLDAPYTATELTSTLTGCADIMAFSGAGGAYDPSLDRLVLYAPQSAGGSTAANHIVIFDPATMTCVEHPQIGGSGPAAQVNNTTGGIYGHFQYLSRHGVYGLFVDLANNAQTFAINPTATHGLGLGATLTNKYTCVDRDGDGYGTGPGCTGPDADDQDSGVHSAAQFTAKWTDIPTGLRHLGYNPTNIWYVTTGGNDTTGAVNNPALPFATCCGAGKANPTAGDAVILSGGAYTFWANAVSGTAAHPTILMSYPGELASFLSYPSGFNLSGLNWVVVDGMRFDANGSQAGIAIQDSSHIVLRHVEASRNEWGFSGGSDSLPMVDITVEDSVFHDQTGVSAQHGIYLTSHAGLISKDIFVRRNLIYNNDYTGMQFNGRVTNLVQEQNITYNNLVAGWSWENGVSNSINRNNVSMNDGKGISLSLYNGNEGLPLCNLSTDICNCTTSPNIGAICAFPQNNNLIENFSVYMTGKDRDGAGQCSGGSDNGCAPAVEIGRQGSYCTTTACTTATQSGNVFRNLAIYTNGSAPWYPPIQFPDSTGVTFLPSTTFDKVFFANGGGYTSVLGYGPGASYGLADKSCAQAATLAASFTGCTNADPQFVAASTTYWATPALFDLRLSAGSPAIASGSVAMPGSRDVLGNPRSLTAPSVGAYEYQGVVASVSPASLPAGTVGTIYSQTLTASSFSGTVTWSLLSGSLPTGLSGCTSGTGTACSITGTPSTTSGSPFAFTIRASDGTTPVDTAYSLTINAGGGGGNGGTKQGGKATSGGKISH